MREEPRGRKHADSCRKGPDGQRDPPRAVLQPRGDLAQLHSRASLEWLGSTFFALSAKSGLRAGELIGTQKGPSGS